EMTVVKRSGRRVTFDRDKLSKSIEIAVRKRPIEAERIERLVSGLVRRLESSGEAEIASSTIGEMVMEALRRLDPVAYVRFASVYREFRNAADFEDVVAEIARDIGTANAPAEPAGAASTDEIDDALAGGTRPAASKH
ncbi:MAG: transcriptional regulator NrdR, partial [Hyphomicrobiaceae bacterium]|nr:transcriptional regulator NrdR [Hyphomicrobiaceae bacterium]